MPEVREAEYWAGAYGVRSAGGQGMKNLHEIDQYRRLDLELRAHGVVGDRGNGMFVVPLGEAHLCVIASNGGGWDHVSVSTEFRCPTWDEMEHVRKLVSAHGEVWVQFGVPAAEHINFHPYCLHWWRHQRREQRLPPSYMVGPTRGVA